MSIGIVLVQKTNMQALMKQPAIVHDVVREQTEEGVVKYRVYIVEDFHRFLMNHRQPGDQCFDQIVERCIMEGAI